MPKVTITDTGMPKGVPIVEYEVKDSTEAWDVIRRDLVTASPQFAADVGLAWGRATAKGKDYSRFEFTVPDGGPHAVIVKFDARK